MVMYAMWKRKIPTPCIDAVALKFSIFTVDVLNFFISFDFVEILKGMSRAGFASFVPFFLFSRSGFPVLLFKIFSRDF